MIEWLYIEALCLVRCGHYWTFNLKTYSWKKDFEGTSITFFVNTNYWRSIGDLTVYELIRNMKEYWNSWTVVNELEESLDLSSRRFMHKFRGKDSHRHKKNVSYCINLYWKLWILIKFIISTVCSSPDVGGICQIGLSKLHVLFTSIIHLTITTINYFRIK